MLRTLTLILALVWFIPMLATAQGKEPPSGLTFSIYDLKVSVPMEESKTMDQETLDEIQTRLVDFVNSVASFYGFTIVDPKTEDKIEYLFQAEIIKSREKYALSVRFNDEVPEKLTAEGEEDLLITLTKVVGNISNASESGWEALKKIRHEQRRLVLVAKLLDSIDEGEMITIPAGEMVMGDDKGNPDERPSHRVKVNAFELDKYEITCRSFVTFLNDIQANLDGIRDWFLYDNYSLIQRRPDGEWHVRPGYDVYPVFNLSWYGAVAYCGSKGKRLPTENEWEYATRGGTQTVYYWGDTWNPATNNNQQYTGELASLRIAIGNWNPSNPTPLPVGQFEPNPFGLYDMIGNIWEWTLDSYKPYPNYRTDSTHDYDQPQFDVAKRVLRGGSFSSADHNSRVALRLPSIPGSVNDLRGFRCAK